MVAALSLRSGLSAPRSAQNERVVDGLARVGLEAAPSDIVWVSPPPQGLSLLSTKRALVHACKPGEQHDIYSVAVHTSPEGAVLRLAGVHNLTRTPNADEGVPMVDGQQVVFTTSLEGVMTNLYALDLSRKADVKAEDATRLGQWQTRITNLQETGQAHGIERRGWTFDPSPSTVQVALKEGEIVVVADGRTIRLPREGVEPLEGKSWIRPHRTAKARPGNFVTWAVDRVRGLSWFGDDRMQAFKALVFDLKDHWERLASSMGGDTSEKDIAADLGGLAHTKPLTVTDPETGWPPPPIKPFITPLLPGEGDWVPIQNDPFVASSPGVPPAFITSFIRTDRERRYTRVYVTLWDPRQVQLHMMAGTVEPIGETGEAGPGLIPRTPEILGRLVGGLNGGFQAMHGEFGMMGDGVVYLPPKPFGATVAELRDGSTAFGTWPKEPEIPDSILSYRQNMTVIVKDEKFNPYRRTWWGGTPPDQTDKVHTTRSAICLTKENFIGYFYGAELAAEVLAQALIQARCRFGIHLDMNVGHTGLEFYRAAPTAQLGSLGRPLQTDWEAEGTIPGMSGWSFRGRRMIRAMPLMNFPRYIHREARDFFYLTLRNILPGPDIPGVPEPESHWQTSGLPQHGFPAAIASALVHPDRKDPSLQVRLVKIDPRSTSAPGMPGSDETAPTIVAFSGIARSRQTRPALWLGRGVFTISQDHPEQTIELFAGLSPGELPTSSDAAAVGITDEGGMLVYAAILAQPGVDGGVAKSPAESASLLTGLLSSMGCSTRMLLPRRLQLALEGTVPIDTQPGAEIEGASIRLIRGVAPGAHTIFDDTPITTPDVWQPLQMRRIRYFKKPTPASSSSSPSSVVPVSSPHPISLGPRLSAPPQSNEPAAGPTTRRNTPEPTRPVAPTHPGARPHPASE